MLLNISWKKTPWKLNPFFGWRRLWFNLRNIWFWLVTSWWLLSYVGLGWICVGVSLGLATCIIDQSSSKKYWDSIRFQVTYFQIVPMLLLLLEASVYTSNFLCFCKWPKLEKLIYITFVHVSLHSLKLKISPSIIITEGEKNSMCKLSRQVNCRNVWMHILSLYKKERKKNMLCWYPKVRSKT